MRNGLIDRKIGLCLSIPDGPDAGTAKARAAGIQSH